MDQNFFIKKRHQFENLLPENALAVIKAGSEVIESLDENYKFSVNNNYYYLTGIDEPEGILVFTKNSNSAQCRLFIRKPDPDKEKWFGRYMTIDTARSISGIETIYYLSDWEEWFNSVKEKYTIYCDNSVPDHQKNALNRETNDLTPFFIQLRLKKESEEIEMLKKAIEITEKGIDAILFHLKPGMMEYQAQALFEYTIADLGADGPSFHTIAASGENGPILHYQTNRNELKDNTMVLFDLGAKFSGYCADISRTFPVNGKFTDDQRILYSAVLTSQKKIIENYQVGRTMSEVQKISKDILWEEGEKTGLFAENSVIDDYYYHGIGHSLGLDTHDLCENRNLCLEPGMVITCEPGLYIAERNMGIRIEDDILITDEGPVVLSKNIPKEPDIIEKMMKQ